MNEREELSQLVAQAVQEGVATDVILQRLRDDGASKIYSIRALRDGAKMPLADAKRVVHFSAAWADRKESDEKFWDNAEAAAKELTEQNTIPGSDVIKAIVIVALLAAGWMILGSNAVGHFWIAVAGIVVLLIFYAFKRLRSNT